MRLELESSSVPLLIENNYAQQQENVRPKDKSVKIGQASMWAVAQHYWYRVSDDNS